MPEARHRAFVPAQAMHVRCNDLFRMLRCRAASGPTFRDELAGANPRASEPGVVVRRSCPPQSPSWPTVWPVETGQGAARDGHAFVEHNQWQVKKKFTGFVAGWLYGITLGLPSRFRRRPRGFLEGRHSTLEGPAESLRVQRRPNTGITRAFARSCTRSIICLCSGL